MASLQAKIRNGRKYWCIVESKRINGKPRSKVIEYLGSADTLLAKLKKKQGVNKLKSYSHGCVAILLLLAKKLDVVSVINKYTVSRRDYWTKQPIRNNITAGITLLLAAIGRTCEPTSKRGWSGWAESTSCEHLLRISVSNLDSQHFWDLMDCIQEDAIDKMELEILQKVLINYPLNNDTLFYDTTNFFTFINSTNDRCEIAKRGKNKQKRNDLRQIGLALVVTQEDYIPLLHYTYQGNISDCNVFAKTIENIKKRMECLKMNVDNHTIVFDRGCNSKINLEKIKQLKLHYVGALTPYHHKDLIEVATENFIEVQVRDVKLNVFREKREVWGEERTVLVYISENLKAGQIRGVYQSLEKKKKNLKKIQTALLNPKSKKLTKEELTKKIDKVLTGQFMEGLIHYKLTRIGDKNEFNKSNWILNFEINQKKIALLEDQFGFRIIMTSRHDWESSKIINTYHGQAKVENAFKNIKNPFHLAIKPGFHWTDQKIKIHYFICVLGYLLTTLIWHEARKNGFKGSLDNLLNSLNGIRLSKQLELTGKKGKPKISYQLEEMSEEQNFLLMAFEALKTHQKPIQINGIREYI